MHAFLLLGRRLRGLAAAAALMGACRVVKASEKAHKLEQSLFSPRVIN